MEENANFLILKKLHLPKIIYLMAYKYKEQEYRF